jgi:hypothetical protein
MNGESGNGTSWSIGDWHIPTVLAVTGWFAAGLAVLGYTMIAYKETAGGASSLDASPPGEGSVVDPSSMKQLEKGKLPKKLLQYLPQLKGGKRMPANPELEELVEQLPPIKPTNRGKFTPSPDAPR